MQLYQHQRATNDSNGNPRRLYAVWQTQYGEYGDRWTRLVAVHDEGYRGRPKALARMYELSPVNVPPAEYRDMIRLARDEGILHTS